MKYRLAFAFAAFVLAGCVSVEAPKSRIESAATDPSVDSYGDRAGDAFQFILDEVRRYGGKAAREISPRSTDVPWHFERSRSTTLITLPTDLQADARAFLQESFGPASVYGTYWSKAGPVALFLSKGSQRCAIMIHGPSAVQGLLNDLRRE